MIHPKNKAERRRLNTKKKLKRLDHDHEEGVQRRLAQEAAETKEALEELGIYRSLDKPEDISWHYRFLVVCYKNGRWR